MRKKEKKRKEEEETEREERKRRSGEKKRRGEIKKMERRIGERKKKEDTRRRKSYSVLQPFVKLLPHVSRFTLSRETQHLNKFPITAPVGAFMTVHTFPSLRALTVTFNERSVPRERTARKPSWVLGREGRRSSELRYRITGKSSSLGFTDLHALQTSQDMHTAYEYVSRRFILRLRSGMAVIHFLPVSQFRWVPTMQWEKQTIAAYICEKMSDIATRQTNFTVCPNSSQCVCLRRRLPFTFTHAAFWLNLG